VDKALTDRIGRWVQQAARSPDVLPAGDRPSSEPAGCADPV
jgi:hypothetical protein